LERAILIILLFGVLVSCKEKTKLEKVEKKQTEIRYYPTDRPLSNETLELIGLDTTELNFRQLTNKVGTYYRKTSLIVEFDDQQIKKRITPYIYSGGYIRFRNVLQIKSDSILIDDGYPINELKRILKRHYLNKGKIPYYSQSPKKALVEVTLDTNRTGKEIKEVLTKLTRTFDEIKEEINDTIELRIFFDYFRQIPPPPPPPKMEIESE
jgi:hypothetical protein